MFKTFSYLYKHELYSNRFIMLGEKEEEKNRKIIENL